MQKVVTRQAEEEREVTNITKLICLDWIELSMIIKLPVVTDNNKYWLDEKTYIIRAGNHSKAFEGTYLMFIDEIKIGEIKYNSQYSNIPHDTVHLRLDNKLLYSIEGRKYIDYIIHVLKFKFSHLSRIDVAIDVNDSDVITYIKTCQNSNRIRLKGRKKKITSIGSGKITETIYIGTASSGKQIRVYKKLPEIQKNSKDYILDYYDLNGFDYKNVEVQRVELSLRTKNLKNIEIEKLWDVNYLASICQNHFKDYFEFVSEYREHNKKVRKILTPVNLEGFKTTVLTKVVHMHTESLRTLKMLLKGLYVYSLHEELRQSQSILPENLITASLEPKLCFLGAIETILQNKPALLPYFQANQKKWRKAIKNN